MQFIYFILFYFILLFFNTNVCVSPKNKYKISYKYLIKLYWKPPYTILNTDRDLQVKNAKFLNNYYKDFSPPSFILTGKSISAFVDLLKNKWKNSWKWNCINIKKNADVNIVYQ